MVIQRLFYVVIALVAFSSNVATGQGLLRIFDFEPAEAEEEDEIETDRDSFTPATTTAGDRRWIVESAYTFIDNRSVPETHSFPELLFRRGVGDWLELRVGWNYEVGGAGNPTSGNVPSDLEEEPLLERESRVFYGLKTVLLEQCGLRPSSTFLIQGYTPTSGEVTDTEMSATYITGWTSARGTTWDSAIRVATSSLDDDNFKVWSPSTVIKFPIGERWKAHAEYFGIFTDGRELASSQHFFSPGAHYLITPNLEIGCRVGWGLNDQAPNFFSNAGFGWRY